MAFSCNWGNLKYEQKRTPTERNISIFQRGLGSNGLSGSRRESRPLLGQTLTTAITLLLKPGGKKLLVLSCISVSLGDSLLLVSNSSSLPLKCQRSHKPLDLGGFAHFLTFLVSEFAAVSVDILPDIIILSKVEQLADLGSSLGTSHPWLLGVGKPGKILLTLLDNDKVKNREILADNATTDRLSSPLSSPPSVSSETRSTSVKQKADTTRGENSLFHWETLLVATSHDLEDVPLELLAQSISANFLGEPLVVKSTELLIVIDLELLLATSGRISDVELHRLRLKLPLTASCES